MAGTSPAMTLNMWHNLLIRTLLPILRGGRQQRLIVFLHLRVAGEDLACDRGDRVEVTLRLVGRERDELAAVLLPYVLGALDVGDVPVREHRLRLVGFFAHDRLELGPERLHELAVDHDRSREDRRRQVGHRLGDVVILERDEGRGGRDHAVDCVVLHRRQGFAQRQGDGKGAELAERIDLDRRAALGADFLALEVGHRAHALMREQHQRAVDGGGEDLDALVGAEGCEPRADRRIVDHLVAVHDIVEQAGRVEHLEARLEAHPEAVGGAAGLDRAERHALDHRGELAELVGGVDLELEAAAGAGFDAGFERLVIFMHHVVDRRRRQLHGELLRARRGRGQQSGRSDAGERKAPSGRDLTHTHVQSSLSRAGP